MYHTRAAPDILHFETTQRKACKCDNVIIHGEVP